MWELLNGLHLARLNKFLILLLQLCHGGGTCTRSTLVATDMYLLDMAELVDRVQYDNHHDSCTIRVGNDTTWTVQSVLCVNLWNNQRHVVFLTELAWVVNHHSTILGDGFCKLSWCTTASTCEGDVYILEVIVMLEQFYLVFLTFECIFLTCWTLWTKENEVVHWEVSLC